jgi:hypothetical protein
VSNLDRNNGYRAIQRLAILKISFIKTARAFLFRRLREVQGAQMVTNRLGVVRALALCGVFAAAGSAAQAQQIITAVESEQDGNGPSDTQVGTVAGQQLSTTFGGADTRALTDFGVNKIAASGNAAYEQYATSAWLDSYTVAGAPGSTVNVSFTFSVDGLANFDPSNSDFNFNIYALRGNGWAMSGYGVGPSYQSAGSDGPNYERLLLTQTVAERVSKADMRDFEGFYNYANNGGDAGAFGSHVNYNAVQDYYSIETVSESPSGGLDVTEMRYFTTGFQQFVNGSATTPLLPYAFAPQLAQVRAGLEANYSLLDMDQLCVGESCDTGAYPGTDLTLSFDLAAGSTFTLASFLYADDLREGTIDFFHTAKVTGIALSPGATLTSESGALTLQPNGTYGYPAAAPVPEPAMWAMMIGGFGLLGAAARRRTRVRVAFA